MQEQYLLLQGQFEGGMQSIPITDEEEDWAVSSKRRQ